MKFIHLSDLHIGIRLNGYSMIEDQRFILNSILRTIHNEHVDFVIIAGDIYDKSIPSGEAVTLFDGFLSALNKDNKSVFIVSGNHDSPERIGFASDILSRTSVFVSPVFDGNVKCIRLHDAYGDICVHMLPFIKPAVIKALYGEEINTYDDAVKSVIDKMNIDVSERNIMIAHQYITGAERSESEEVSIGGQDNVSSERFDKFDYTALGHLHRPQNVSNTIRYCGTPLKYSFSEVSDHKTITVVDIKEKGNIHVEYLPLTPMRDMRKIKGTYMSLTDKNTYEGMKNDDYLHVTLTDENEIYEAFGKLSVIYPNIMKLDYVNMKNANCENLSDETTDADKSPIDMFEGLFKLQNGCDMTDEQKKYISGIIENIWEKDI